MPEERSYFEAEVGQRFQFLVDMYEMAPPVAGSAGAPYETFSSVRYRRPSLEIVVHLLEVRSGASVGVSINMRDEQASAKVALSRLVEEARFAPQHKVLHKGHTRQAVQKSLDDNATWLRRVMPLVVGLEGPELIRRAGEHHEDRNGNPKPRPRNIKWKYA